MIPADLNLYIKQGASYVLSVTLLQGDMIRTTADVLAGVSALPVEPIRQAIASGRKLLLGDDLVLTLAGAVDVGAVSLPIAPTPLPIAKKTKGWVCADLTGCTANAPIKGKLQTSTSPNQLAASFDTDRLSGRVDLVLTHPQTALLPANLAFGTVFSEEDLQARQRQATDYDWEMEITYPDNHIESPYKGLIVVYPQISDPLPEPVTP
jgi:hypothetical protein